MIIKGSNTAHSFGGGAFKGKYTTGRRSRDFLPAENWSYTTPSKTITISGTSTGPAASNDANVTTTTSATVQTLADVLPNIPLSTYVTGQATFGSSNAGVATVNSVGVVTPVSAGTTNITVSVPGLSTRSIPITVVQTGGQTTTTFVSFVSGSLAYAIATTADSAISGKIAGSGGYHAPGSGVILGANQSLFSAYNPSGSFFTRNSSLFESADFTCLAASYAGGSYFGGTLISPQHFITANHNLLNGNAAGTLQFVDNSNNASTNTVTANNFVNISGADIAVVKLDQPVASGITFAKFLPSNYALYLPGLQYGIPAVTANQFKTLSICEWYQVTGSAPAITIRQPLAGTRSGWYSPAVTNDSSSPLFLIIGGQTIVLSCWYTANTGPSYADYLTQIAAAMTTLGGGYSPTTVNLSGYTFF
jgi:hypothetical protein